MIINNLVKYEVDNITSNRSTSFKMNMCLYKQSLIGARPFNFQNSFPTFLFFYMNVNFLPSVTRDLMISKQQPLLTSERKYWLSRYLYHPNSTICFFLVRIFVRSRQQSSCVGTSHDQQKSFSPDHRWLGRPGWPARLAGCWAAPPSTMSVLPRPG